MKKTLNYNLKWKTLYLTHRQKYDIIKIVIITNIYPENKKQNKTNILRGHWCFPCSFKWICRKLLSQWFTSDFPAPDVNDHSKDKWVKFFAHLRHQWRLRLTELQQQKKNKIMLYILVTQQVLKKPGPEMEGFFPFNIEMFSFTNFKGHNFNLTKPLATVGSLLPSGTKQGFTLHFLPRPLQHF